MENKSVFITGGTGLLGTSIIEGLLGEGYKVTALLRSDSKNLVSFIKRFPNVSIVYGSLSSPHDIPLPKGEIFIHLAWEGTTPLERANEDIQRKNYENSLWLLKKAKAKDYSLFLFAGSQAEYGFSGSKEKEDQAINPSSQYGIHKAKFGQEASGFCKENGMDFLHLRIFSVYGDALPRSGLLFHLLNSFKNKTYFEMGPCTQLWNYLYIEDFKRIVLSLLKQQNVNEIVNVGSSDTRPLKEFVELAYNVLGASNEIRFGENNPNPEGLVPLDPDIGKMVRLTGVEDFLPFEEGVKRFYSALEREQ